MPWRSIAVLLLVAATAVGWWLVRPSPTRDAGGKQVDQKIANIAFMDADAKTTHLYDLNDKKAIVLVFLSFECPVSTSYMQPLADLAREFTQRGVAFVGLTTNQDDTASDVARCAKDFRLPFPVFLDRNLAAADAVAAGYTPEVFVLDASRVVCYRGRIDDAYGERLKRNQRITRHDLRQA